MPRPAPPLPLLALALLLTACTPPLTTSQRQQRERLSQLPYPADAAYGPDLDIAAVRDGSTLTLANRTASPYRDVQLWLNRQYVRELPVIRIGPDNRLDLDRFVNEHREPFPVGTLLAPDEAFPVVLAELYDPDTELKHRLLVWPDDTTP